MKIRNFIGLIMLVSNYVHAHTAIMPTGDLPVTQIAWVSKEKVIFIGSKEPEILWIWNGSTELRVLSRNIEFACFDNKAIYSKSKDKEPVVLKGVGPAYINMLPVSKEESSKLLKHQGVCIETTTPDTLKDHILKLGSKHKIFFDFGKPDIKKTSTLAIRSLTGEIKVDTKLKVPGGTVKIQNLDFVPDSYFVYVIPSSKSDIWKMQEYLVAWNISIDGATNELHIPYGEWATNDVIDIQKTAKGYLVHSNKGLYYIDSENKGKLLISGYVDQPIVSPEGTMVSFIYRKEELSKSTLNRIEFERSN